ncbi:MAG: TolC family protein [Cyclobacteriaceae bacterium]|jgi:outer membrane protein TolC|nr:TolC family protein [Cyclobacteriaceae bacterium]
MRKFFMYCGLMLMVIQLPAQTAPGLTLEQCYDLARKNYPLIRQKELLVRSMEYTIANANTAYLPQVSIYGQATYQSDVTRIPGPSPFEPLSKDQYKVYAELTQTIYDGGTTKGQTSVQQANTLVEQQKTEVELYKVKDRINQLFFGILLTEAQLNQIALLHDDLTNSLMKMESAIKNGTAFRTNADILQAEIFKADQRTIEMKAARKGYLEMLSQFINMPLAEDTKLERPVLLSAETNEVKRPELQLFKFQQELLQTQYQANQTRNMPRLGFFVQGGYGRPGLNVLKNQFDTYYLGGLRLSWALSGFYNSRRDRELLDVNHQLVGTQTDLFLFNTNLALRQQNQEVTKLRDLIVVDSKIIDLRARIKTTAKAQHENGVISTNDLLREINAEDTARQNLLLHEIQLMLAQFNYQSTTGN